MRRRQGFTLVELLIVVAIIAVLAGILLPVLFAAKGRGQTSSCQSNLKQIGYAFRAYCDDCDGRCPLGAYQDPHVPRFGQYTQTSFIVWPELLFQYGADPGIFQCPARRFKQEQMQNNTFPTSYCYNTARGADGRSLPGANIVSEVELPTNTIVCADGWGSVDVPGTSDEMGQLYSGQSVGGISSDKVLRHQGAANFLFCDTHVKSQKTSTASQWTLSGDPD
jgi:prepilin-type N-terminal cleavage/methylation domain-containing protein/prepilin-type processing-associated H-X9-DG protein